MDRFIIKAQRADLRSKIEVQGVELESRIETRGARIEAHRTVLAAHTTSLRWMTGILVAVFGTFMVLLVQALRGP